MFSELSVLSKLSKFSILFENYNLSSLTKLLSSSTDLLSREFLAHFLSFVEFEFLTNSSSLRSFHSFLEMFSLNTFTRFNGNANLSNFMFGTELSKFVFDTHDKNGLLFLSHLKNFLCFK